MSAPGPFFERDLETLDRDRLRGLQWRRLGALARDVVAANPFVRARWGAAGLRDAADLRSWDDFQALPFTTKAELVADQAGHPPFGSNLTYPVERYTRVHQTSGTTGTPVRWLDTAESWDWFARCWSFVLTAAGVTAADRIFFPFSFGLFVGFWAGFEAARQLGALAIPAGGQDSRTRLAWLEALGATVVVSTPTYALHLAEVARAHAVPLRDLPVRITIHAGEPGAGIPEVRRQIEEAWGARAFDHAGMTEVGAYGYECAERTGLHVNESEFIAEVVDPATGAAAVEGELVLTSLGRTGSPVFRYRTGDRVRLAPEPCPCGRTFLRLAGGVLGRLDDLLIIRGVNVFPSAVEGVVRRFPEVGEFQLVVERRGALDDLRVLVEVDAAAAGAAAELRAALRSALGIRIEVATVAPGTLPRHEHKARRIERRR